MKPRQPPPVPIAETPPWCRVNFPAYCVRISSFHSSLSKEDAIKALKKHYQGKFFLPKCFTQENHVQEIRGIYVPFWMFDGEAEGDAHYEAARSRTYRSGDYEITETKHYDVYRAGAVTFEKVPVDASSKIAG